MNSGFRLDAITGNSENHSVISLAGNSGSAVARKGGRPACAGRWGWGLFLAARLRAPGLLGPARGPGATAPARPRRVDRPSRGLGAGAAPARPAPGAPAPARPAPGATAPAGPAVVDVARRGADQAVRGQPLVRGRRARPQQ